MHIFFGFLIVFLSFIYLYFAGVCYGYIRVLLIIPKFNGNILHKVFFSVFFSLIYLYFGGGCYGYIGMLFIIPKECSVIILYAGYIFISLI